MLDVSIVVAIYNEEESIPALCEQLDRVMRGLGRSYEILLVDDGSRDRSWETLLAMAAQYPCLKLIRFRRNFGQTPAIAAGFDAAEGEVVITLDADLQNDPADIPMLLEHIARGVDVVSGWRKDRQDRFLDRKLPSMLANGLISKITGVRLHDYGCSLKAYRREIVKNLKLYGEMHRFIPALASWVGGRIDEVPVRHHARRFGKSKYGISRTLRVVLDLMTVKFLLQYSTRPIQIFGRIGIRFGAVALAMLLLVVADWAAGMCGAYAEGGWLAGACPWLGPHTYLLKRPFWIITPLVFLGFCLQFITLGLMAEIQTRTYHESQNKPIYVIRETAGSKSKG
ncbi:MAG: glycosyltransferase family 2 protein [Kiritimatiellae bacterium]|nr:glycosyltransferase family 2 protein [Kiritimatiellia bacterium]